MRILSGRTNWAVVFLAASVLRLLAQAQASSGTNAAPEGSGAGSAPATASSGQPGADPAAGSASSTLDYLFNHKPEQGSVAKEGMDANQQAKTHALAEDALGDRQIQDPDLRAQFESYLAMNEVPSNQLDAYSTQMSQVIDLLHQRKTTAAWQQLYALAKFQSIDAGVSWELANRIESIWNAGHTKDQIAMQNHDLQQRADTDNRNADMDSSDIKDKELDYQRRQRDANKSTGPAVTRSSSPNGGVPQAPQGDAVSSATSAPISDQLMGKLQLTQEYLDSLAAQAKIKLNELKVEKLFDQAKQDFADYITTLYKSGRYQHVLIAANFWRQIFDEGDYPVAMAQQVNASLETIGQVQTTIGVFNNNLAQHNVATATGNLQQAYVMSPFSPAVLGVSLANKKPVLTFSRDLSQMRSMIEARDFTDLETLLVQVKEVAPDFDAVKARSIVNGVKLESQLDLGKAKLAAQQGDLKSAMSDFQEAAEAWPDNPDLKNSSLDFFKSEDTQHQALAEFDRLVAENNYRGIYEKQLQLAPAMKDDSKRQDQLKAALEKVKGAEMAREKAALMQSNGDVDGAWETVQLAAKDLPDDVQLNTLRADLAGKGAEFVGAINKAQDAEAKQELGYSLSWYAVALRRYPASTIAREAVDRLTKSILAKSSI